MVSLSKLFACAVGGLSLCVAVPATAAQLLATYTGIVQSGVDNADIFGSPGVDLAGETFTATFVYDTTLGRRITAPGSYDFVEGGSLISLSTPVLSAKLTIGGVRVALDPSAYSSQAVDSEPGNCCGPFVYSDVAGPKLTGFQLGDSAYLEADGVPSPSIADPIPTTAASITGIGQFFRDGATGGAVLTTAVNFNSSGYVTVSAIPEPETWVMLIAGLGLVGVAARAARGRRAVRPAPGLA